jgi:hypothetical protein
MPTMATTDVANAGCRFNPRDVNICDNCFGNMGGVTGVQEVTQLRCYNKFCNVNLFYSHGDLFI